MIDRDKNVAQALDYLDDGFTRFFSRLLFWSGVTETLSTLLTHSRLPAV
jgi:hypothetical protein